MNRLAEESTSEAILRQVAAENTTLEKQKQEIELAKTKKEKLIASVPR